MQSPDGWYPEGDGGFAHFLFVAPPPPGGVKTRIREVGLKMRGNRGRKTNVFSPFYIPYGKSNSDPPGIHRYDMLTSDHSLRAVAHVRKNRSVIPDEGINRQRSRTAAHSTRYVGAFRNVGSRQRRMLIKRTAKKRAVSVDDQSGGICEYLNSPRRHSRMISLCRMVVSATIANAADSQPAEVRATRRIFRLNRHNA